MNLCTIIIPSRGRIDKLFRAVESIFNSSTGADYTISVRLDDDDSQSLGREDELRSYTGVKVTVGPSPGWSMLDQKVYSPLAKEADSQWVWIFNDDMTIGGKGWDEQLARVPAIGYWCQPEFHKLNESVYERDERSCAPIFVNQCWKLLGMGDDIPTPCDDVLVARLKQKQWKPWFLEGITVWHDRNK